MGKQMVLIAAAAVSALAFPALANPLPPGTTAVTGITFTPFLTATQGTLLASSNTGMTNPATTFSGVLATAVYQNTLGGLDFYYQFARTGAGPKGNNVVEKITAGSFAGQTVSAFFSNVDLDGAGGIFQAGTNTGLPGFATRDVNGEIVGADFSANPLTGTQISSIYIFRTNATRYDANGTYGVIDASVQGGDSFQPAGAVPETSAWSMMIVGFGAVGATMRRRKRGPALLGA